MKSAVSELFSSEGVRPPKTFAQREAISERVVALLGGFVALLLVGCGLGWSFGLSYSSGQGPW